MRGLGESLRAHGGGAACLRQFETVERSGMEARAGGELQGREHVRSKGDTKSIVHCARNG